MKIVKKNIYYLIVKTNYKATELEQKLKKLNFNIDSCFVVNGGVNIQGNEYVIELLYNTLKINPNILD